MTLPLPMYHEGELRRFHRFLVCRQRARGTRGGTPSGEQALDGPYHTSSPCSAVIRTAELPRGERSTLVFDPVRPLRCVDSEPSKKLQSVVNLSGARTARLTPSRQASPNRRPVFWPEDWTGLTVRLACTPCFSAPLSRCHDRNFAAPR